ncbi:MAG: AraC family transcriptional regulator [Phycisphaerae bacterium]
MPAHVDGVGRVSLVLSGAARELIASSTSLCLPGSVVIKAADAEHETRIAASGLCVFTIWSAESESTLVGGWLSSLREYGWSHAGRAATVLRQVYSRFVACGVDSAIGRLAESLGALDANVALGAPQWLRAVRARLECEKPPSATDLAGDAGVHPVYLARLFRRNFGLSMRQYVQSLRTERAARHLTEGRVGSLAQLAVELGYVDQPHFTQCFRRQVGVPPAAYRALALRIK